MTYIPDYLRQQVRERAQGNCEYCLLNERYALKTHEVDHIRAEKHGGNTEPGNLCLSCFDCNRKKESDLSWVDPVTDEVVPLFHPRRDIWIAHFHVAATDKSRARRLKGESPSSCWISMIQNV